ncbi:hypothetical protein QE363_001611 [Sphingomonas sp. SORGH_AS870]|uniref:hypothetical protein n=1 Tax=Sphingomonas sp. SORGH_AS_0870 TaxID=3041801 RepID=UPI0028597A9E|nr:hypothetical protein [Sphingomonas sp. SORGH_AS_0870]MDR6145818.1 hypothetical protein [Sphingomonas sp. SORGH_AS_0870]
MKPWFPAIAAVVAVATPVAATPRTPASPAPAARSGCDRGCLLDMTNRYLLALEAHDAARLPLAPGAMVYENGRPGRLDDGVWKDATIITGRSTIVDPEAGQAIFFGIVRRKDAGQALYVARLKVADGRITEVEQLTAGKDDLLFNPDGVHFPKPIWSDVLPPEERVPAAELRRIANLYFQSIQEHDPTIVPFHPDCNRTENGTPTTNTNRPDVITSDSCDIGVTKFGWIPVVRERRFPIVDTARGLVIGISHLDVVPGISSNNGPKADAPFTFVIYEIFKIVDGRILDIECFMITPKDRRSIWPVGPFYEKLHPYRRAASPAAK